MKPFTVFLLTLMSPFFANSISTPIKTEDLSEEIKLKVHIKDGLPSEVPRSLVLQLHQIYSSTKILQHSSEVKANKNLDGLETKLKAFAPINYLEVYYNIKGRKGSDYSIPFLVYRIKAGTSIEMELYKDSIIFKGENSRELNLQTAFFRLVQPRHNKISDDDPAYFKLRNEEYLADEQNQLRWLFSNKATLSPELYHYLYYQCLGLSRVRMINRVTVANLAGNQVAGKRGITYYKQHLTDPVPSYTERAHESSYFMDYLYRKEKLNFQIEEQKFGYDLSGGKELLDRIRRKYSGLVLERLMIIGVLDLATAYVDMDSYLTERRIKFSPESPYFQIGNAVLKASTNFAKAYNFSLKNSADKIVRLSDFKGKTVILDFWFTGCKPCLQFKESMEPVHAYFRKRSDIIFITISIDSKKEMWFNSLRSGLYADAESVNLRAGEGLYDPLLVHYNIIAFPRVMLIDKKGNLITQNIGRPINKKATDELILKLENATKDIFQ